MKIISITHQDNAIGNESFITNMFNKLAGESLGLLSKSSTDKVLQQIFSGNDNTQKLRRAKELLDKTVNDKSWVSKTISKKTSTHNSQYMWIDAKAEPSVSKVVSLLCGPMYDRADDVLLKLKSNTKLRLELIKKIESLNSAEQVDDLFKSNEKELGGDLVSLYKQNGGKNCSVISSIKKHEWPVEVYPFTNKEEFCEVISYHGKSPIEPLTENNCNVFGTSVLELIKTAIAAEKLYDENNIPYWEACPFDYDELKYSDEIFETIYTSQSPYQASPVRAIEVACLKLAEELLKVVIAK